MAAQDRHDSERPTHRSTLTGARNDDSSLFSLDMIRRAEESAARASGEHDESGLIDLRALADLAKSAPSRVDSEPLVVSASASLFSATPASMPPASQAEAMRAEGRAEGRPDFAPKRGNILLVMGAVAAVAVASAAFLLMQGTDAPPKGAEAAAMGPGPTTPLPPSTPATAPPSQATQLAAVTPGQRAPTVESPKPAAPVAKPAAPRPARAESPRAAAPEAAPKVEAPPAAPVCDLTCQMEKAVAKTR